VVGASDCEELVGEVAGIESARPIDL